MHTYLCRTPSNLFDFLTANTSPSRPFLYRTFMTLPNSPLPTSSSSTKSRSNRPERGRSGSGFGTGACGRLCACVWVAPEIGNCPLVEGELRVATELEDEPETDRPVANLMTFFPGENCVGIHDGGHSAVNHKRIKNSSQ